MHKIHYTHRKNKKYIYNTRNKTHIENKHFLQNKLRVEYENHHQQFPLNQTEIYINNK